VENSLKKYSASQVYMVMNFLASFANATMFTTYAVYYISELGLTPLQLVLVGTFLEVTCLVFEGITGVVADAYSRRLSVIIGIFVIGGAYVVEGSVPWIGAWLPGIFSFFVLIVIAEMIRGVGETFLSGATQAWIVDEVGEEKIGPVFLRAQKFTLLAALLGVGASVGLASVARNLPFMAGGILYLLLGLFLVLYMKEHGFKPERREDRNAFQNMADTWKEGARVVRSRPILLTILVVTLFTGAASEGYDRLWEAHLLNDITFPAWAHLSTVMWFGLLSLVGTLLSLVVVRFADRRLDLTQPRVVATSMFVLTGLRMMAMISFAFAPTFLWALLSVLAIMMISSVSGPVYDTWLNQNIDGKVRATVLSMMSQSNALGQTAGGPVVGAIGSRFSVRASILTAAVLLSPILAVFGRVLRGKKADNAEAAREHSIT
jgi:MFS family permease